MKNHETGGYRATLITELHRGESSRLYVDPNHYQERGPRIAADIIYGGQDGAVAEDSETPGQRLLIVDLRDAERLANGAILYDGQMLDPSTAFLAIDPAQLNWKENKGYKGIRAREVVTFGRGQHEDRFPVALDTTSRQHVAVSFDPERNELEIADLSSNGTTIRSGSLTHELPRQQHDIDDTVPSSWGEKYVQPQEPNEFGPRTLTDQARVLDAEVVARSAQEWRADRHHPAITHDVLAAQGLEPILGIALKDKEFMFSGLIADEHGREYSIGYTRDEKQRVIPRMFYKSNSDGGWRVSPYIYEDGVFNKGDLPSLRYADGSPAQYGQYAQATKPDESIVALLEEMERKQVRANAPRYSAEHMIESLKQRQYERSGIHDTFEREVDVTCVGGYGLDAYSSGVGFRYDSDMSRGMIEAMKLPPGFQPDFSKQAQRSYLTEHTILGKTHVEVYAAQFEGKLVEWHVAHAQESDTVWLDRISMPDSDVTQYGTRKELVLAGALSAKPVDYRSQARGMVPGVDFVDVAGRGHSSYVSIKPLLDKMPWVKEYRHAQLAAVAVPEHAAERPRQRPPAEFIDHIPDEIRFAGARADQQAALAKEQERIVAERKATDRLAAMYAFPAPQGKDRFGNSLDERRRVTPESTEAAAMAYRFVDEHIKQLIKSVAGDKWREGEMQEVVRDNDALRTAIGNYLMDKMKSSSLRLPDRLIRNQQKRPGYRGYDAVPDLSGREYATLLALSMLDGTFKPSRTGDAIEVSKYGDVLQGQHRYAALKLLGLDTSPYISYLNMKRHY